MVAWNEKSEESVAKIKRLSDFGGYIPGGFGDDFQRSVFGNAVANDISKFLKQLKRSGASEKQISPLKNIFSGQTQRLLEQVFPKRC